MDLPSPAPSEETEGAGLTRSIDGDSFDAVSPPLSPLSPCLQRARPRVRLGLVRRLQQGPAVPGAGMDPANLPLESLIADYVCQCRVCRGSFQLMVDHDMDMLIEVAAEWNPLARMEDQ